MLFYDIEHVYMELLIIDRKINVIQFIMILMIYRLSMKV